MQIQVDPNKIKMQICQKYRYFRKDFQEENYSDGLDAVERQECNHWTERMEWSTTKTVSEMTIEQRQFTGYKCS